MAPKRGQFVLQEAKVLFRTSPGGAQDPSKKGSKKGSFWTPFWAILGPFLEHLLSTIGPFKGLYEGIWAKGPQKGVPDMAQKGVKKGSSETPSVGGSS
jgi:hypothetical protein